MTGPDSQKMRDYWNKVGKREDVNWHIAHIADRDEFYDSGTNSVRKIFPKGLDHIPAGGAILEIGCGPGRITRAVASARPDVRVIGLDVSHQLVSLAYGANKDLTNVSFVVGDGTSLNLFPDEMFDCVYSYIVFQHCPRSITYKYMDDLGRILKPGGAFVFQVQARPEVQTADPPDTDFRTIRYYTPDQAAALIKNPLHVVNTRGGGHDFFVESVRPVKG